MPSTPPHEPRSGTRSRSTPRTVDPEAITAYVLDTIDEAATKQAKKARAKAAARIDQIDGLDRLAERVDALGVWTRAQPGRRRPRLTRDDIADAAMRIADAEGFDAVSMRRIAADLGAGTMSLYHYVTTKEELHSLLVDAVFAEIALPHGSKLPKRWRDAITVVAHRTRDAIRRHPWILDINDDPPFGPNAVRHFDQSYAALAELQVSIEVKMELIMAIDEYVFGHCMHVRNNGQADTSPHATDEVLTYVQSLLATGEYPTLAAMVAEHGIDATWERISKVALDERRFDRNLRRLLDGFERDLSG